MLDLGEKKKLDSPYSPFTDCPHNACAAFGTVILRPGDYREAKL